MWRDVRNDYAPPAAAEICKRCDCKEVTLKWLWVQPTRFDGLFDLAPKEIKFPCECKTPSAK